MFISKRFFPGPAPAPTPNQIQDEPLPPGWEMRYDPFGMIFFY